MNAIASLPKAGRLAAIEDWEERSAIIEYAGAMSRDDAERAAIAVVCRRFGL